jgi:peroxiredoxin (alkyl hydroperoxide reductase subunit C)
MESGCPLIGDTFPTMTVHTTRGTLRLPDDMDGNWFILLSHPADFTPVCTTEFVSFQKRYEEFRRLSCELVGLSVDQIGSHLKWLEWIEQTLGVAIEFPIIADDLGRVAMKLGLIHPRKGANTVRAVFIVDHRHAIRAILYYPQEIGRNTDEILRMLRCFQVSDQAGVVVPANWPRNELIGDKVILPPAADWDTMEQRRKQGADGYDWWFCTKKLS